MNETLKKIKHLKATVLDYATTKFPNSHKVPPDPQSIDENWFIGTWPSDLKKDFSMVGVLEDKLLSNRKLTASDMKVCNRMYNHYMSNRLGCHHTCGFPGFANFSHFS